jgi:hypothetical protein
LEIMNKPRRSGNVIDALALTVLVIETLATAAIAVGYGVYALLDSESPGLAAALGGVMAVFAIGVGVFAWGFAKRRRFALSGALAWQLMQASVGVWLLSVIPVVGVVLILLSAVVTYAVVRRQATYGREDRNDPS